MALATERAWIGNTLRVTAAFSNTVGAPPPALADVAISARKPDGTLVAGDVQPAAGAGAFAADFVLDRAGTWYVRASCTGAVATAEEQRFEVLPSKVL